ncbi:hypothetical protein [Geomicrobium sp. JCM 19055]|nr:hypothetical protein [Geomicrobium sp. JCM 19055]
MANLKHHKKQERLIEENSLFPDVTIVCNLQEVLDEVGITATELARLTG